MSERRLLLTGFEPYGGNGVNPSSIVVDALHDSEINGVGISGQTLPVTLDGLSNTVGALLDEHDPLAVICLGLAPGTPMIRLERVAVNLADFTIPDNAGLSCSDQPLCDDGPDALFATLPLRAQQKALLAAGIPAQLSETAGTYLCNAISYEFLRQLQQRGQRNIPCGFVHLPYLPQQVAELLARGQLSSANSEDPYRGSASMSLATQTSAVRIIISSTLRG